VHEFRAEAGRKVVATAFEKENVELGEALLHFCDRIKIDRSVLTYCGVWTASSLDTNDSFPGQCLASHQELHIFTSEDVIGDNSQLILVAHAFTKTIEQRCLA